MGGIAPEKIAFPDNIQLSHVSGEHKISLRLFPVPRIRESKECLRMLVSQYLINNIRQARTYVMSVKTHWLARP